MSEMDRYDKQGQELACAFGTARCHDRATLARQIAAALRAARLADASDYEAIQLAEDPRWLVNDLLKLLADSRDYTQRLAEQYGLPLDDAEAFRLNTRSADMAKRIRAFRAGVGLNCRVERSDNGLPVVAFDREALHGKPRP